MSKETFEKRVAAEYLYPRTIMEDTLRLIKDHGGTIHWPLPTPEGAGCTCPPDWLENWAVPQDFDKPGFWHKLKCAFYVPF
jgi:hypothetical protein